MSPKKEKILRRWLKYAEGDRGIEICPPGTRCGALCPADKECKELIVMPVSGKERISYLKRLLPDPVKVTWL